MRKPAADVIAEFITSAKEGRQPLGIFNNLNSPTLIEILGAAGQRFVIFDQEHTSTNHETLVSLIRAAELHDMMTMVRIEKPDSYAAIKALDAGAHGIWVQHLQSAAQVRKFVDALHYAPLGDRNYCTYPRANNNGIGDMLKFIDYSNAHPFIVIGLNNEEILDELDEILSIPGIGGFNANTSDIIVRTGYGSYDDFFQMHNIAKGIHKTIREAGKLIMSNFFAPNMNDLEDTRKFLGEQLVDIWITADIGCLLMGMRDMKKIQTALVDDRLGPAHKAQGSSETTNEAKSGDERESSAMDESGGLRTC